MSCHPLQWASLPAWPGLLRGIAPRSSWRAEPPGRWLRPPAPMPRAVCATPRDPLLPWRFPASRPGAGTPARAIRARARARARAARARGPGPRGRAVRPRPRALDSSRRSARPMKMHLALTPRPGSAPGRNASVSTPRRRPGRPRTIRSSTGCTSPARWSPGRRWPPPRRSGAARPAGRSTWPAACTTPCPPGPPGSASTTTRRWPSPACSTWAPSGSPTSTSTCTTATVCRQVFYDDPRVLTVSLHETPLALFPGTGFPDETGGPGAEGSAVNVPLPPGTDDAGWQRAFHAVVPSVLRAFRPQILVTQCGADGHRLDPLADLRPDRRRAAGHLPGAAGARRRAVRRPLGGHRRRRVRAGRGGAPGLDAPAGGGHRRPARPGDPRPRRAGARWPPTGCPAGRSRCG